MANSQKPLIFRGYTKKEGNRWVAICIDLNIVAQGPTIDEATDKCMNLIAEYIHYVSAEYSHDIGRYLFRPVPQEFIEEYNDMVGRRIQHRPTRAMRPHYFDLARQISACSPA